MKSSKLILSVLACAAVCACSNDESDSVSTEKFTGDEAYITVRLSDVGSSTRATDGGYEYGTTAEQTVQNAYFYFYDANGVFVAEGSAWNGGTIGTTENIEFESNTVVVLKGMTSQNYPKYMVTVLNRPSTFSAPTYLSDMETTLAGAPAVFLDDSDDENFIMSTTSWAEQTTAYYYVTEVASSNFSLEPVDDTANSSNYITVYVERLAAKVTLGISANLAATAVNGRYVVEATVAGDTNAGTDNVASEKLYVELLGWKLNATANDSYMVKNIDETWTDDALGFDWNYPDYFRSFWGMSYNYGQSGYPTSSTEANTESTPYLTYVNLNSDVVTLGSSAYCGENTNTSEVVTANYPQCLTSILLKAQVCDSLGNALDLVRFEGVLYEQDAFASYILNRMSIKNNLNAYVLSDGTYTQISASDVTLENVSDGEVKIQLSTSETLYAKSGDTFTEITDTDSLEEAMATECDGAIGYTGGLMYYNIPIEHLNNTDYTDTIPEAVYGVVRNHHYVVTVTSLDNLGKGIFDPDEVIVPGDDDDDSYYVGATINILSWKLVEQYVTL